MRDVPEEVMDVGHGVVLEVWRRYRMVDPNDLRQEVALWAVSNPGKVRDYMALEEREMRAVVATSLRNRLRRYAEKEKATQAGYEPYDNAWFTADQIEDLLPSVFNPDAWTSPPSQERGSEGRGASLPSERGGWVALLADVAQAWRKLPAIEREIVRAKFEHDEKQVVIARDLGLTEQQVSELIPRAIRAMLVTLGGEKPVREADERTIGHRRAISNSSAQAITANEYGEDA